MFNLISDTHAATNDIAINGLFDATQHAESYIERIDAAISELKCYPQGRYESQALAHLRALRMLAKRFLHQSLDAERDLIRIHENTKGKRND